MLTPELLLAITVAALAGVAIVTGAALTGWRGWLAFKRQELLTLNGDRDDRNAPSAGTRIEIADLKERLRKLEAIAAGVDL